MKSVNNTNHSRPGFTLVEMLVAVALVLLMMSMFAAIFQQAAGAVSTQRGLAENDQRARSVFSLIRADLQKRTFRDLRPFVQNEAPGTSPYDFGTRQGYFYISTNDPNDGTDDLLQFTTNAVITLEATDTTRSFGQARQLLASPITDLNGDGDIDQFDLQLNLVNNPNQPEADDEEVYPNGTATSVVTEVSYFVRGGNLYRRVMLVRDPLNLAGSELEAQPSDTSGTDFFDADDDKATPDYVALDLNGNAVGWPVGGQQIHSFWGNFDYSAYRTFDSATNEWSAARFAGVDALRNEPAGATFFSLGKPRFRFGFDTQTGFSREHTGLGTSASDPPRFLGRFTLGETADRRFGYPQGPSFGSIENPLSLSAATYTLSEELQTAQFAGTDMAFVTGNALTGRSNARRSEDLLLSNVQEFRVEIWDQRAGAFVTPGYSAAGGTVGDLEISSRRSVSAGPFPSETAMNAIPLRLNRTFDTWHPLLTPGVGALGDDAPFRPLAYYAPGLGAGKDEGLWWQPNRTYTTEDVVFPLTQDINGDGFFNPATEDTAHTALGSPFSDANNFMDSQVPWRGLAYHYVCVRSGSSGPLTTPPNWQSDPGAIITEDGDGDGTAGGTNPVNGQPPAVWRAVPNVRAIRAIRVTVRFIDPSTDQSRQVTVIQSLLD